MTRLEAQLLVMRQQQQGRVHRQRFQSKIPARFSHKQAWSIRDKILLANTIAFWVFLIILLMVSL